MKVTVEQSRVVIDPEGVVGGPVVGRTTDGVREWVAAEVSPGRAFVDWQAPLGGVIVYEHAGVFTPVEVFESYRRDELASLNGRVVAPILRLAGRERQIDRDVYEFRAKGAARPFTLQGGPNTHSEPIKFGAGAEATLIVEELLEQTILVVRHNIGMCPVKRCTIPAVRLFSTKSGTVRYVGQDHVGEFNEWSLDGVEPRPPASPVPVRTWADIKRAHSSWAEVSAAHNSWASVRDGGV